MQIQWIRPAQDAYVVLLQTILFLQCLNEYINGKSTSHTGPPEKIVDYCVKKKQFLKKLLGSVGGQGKHLNIYQCHVDA